MLRVMIVDDEAPSRNLLRDMLASFPDVDVVADLGQAKAALEAIVAAPPDLLFLDVQMPGLQGVELVELLPPDKRPAVVFVTAHQDYAHQAFELEAVDYLLKPFDEQRLERAINRVRRRFSELGANEVRRLGQVAARMETGNGPLERLVVRDGERSFFVPVARIAWLESDGKLVRVHTGTESYEFRESLGRIEERLDPNRFLRVSRSAIVNVDRIREVQSWFHGDRIIVMDNGGTVTTTRTYRDRLLKLLEN